MVAWVRGRKWSGGQGGGVGGRQNSEEEGKRPRDDQKISSGGDSEMSTKNGNQALNLIKAPRGKAAEDAVLIDW